VKTVHGDVLARAREGRYDIVVHGCNCVCVMGAGFAKQVRDQFPEAYEADLAGHSGFANAEAKLGWFTYARVYGPAPFVIANAYTQTYPGRGSLSYDGIRWAFRRLRALGYENARWGYPAIGSGLAGGDWRIIADIIDEELRGCDHELVIYP